MSHRYRIALAALAVAAGALTAAPAHAFELGVAAGEVTSSSAIVWTRAPAAGPLTVTVRPLPRGRARTLQLTATEERDRTVQARVGGLRSDTRYTYRFTQGSARSATGRFRTAPRPAARRTVRFAYSGDADAQPATPGGPPFWNDFEVYGRMAAARNDFNVNLGDTIYSDTEVGATTAGGVFVPAAPTALTVPEKWAKYRQNLARPALQKLRAAAGLYSQWDDHEFINDFGPGEYGIGALYPAGVQAFRDYAPVRYTTADGLYRRVRWGRNLELFFLDERSFRSNKASADGVCDNPATGAPDLAPTGPAALRQTFALIIPSLAQPVAQACLDRIADPSRTLLGTRQRERFLADVRASKAPFKVVINEVPIQQLYALPYDRWEGYSAERDLILQGLSGVPGVVFLTTDTHANLVGEARLRTLEPGGVRSTGLFEAVTGPVATATFATELEQAIGQKGAGPLIARLFFTPPPPGGLGLSCAATNIYSYGQVAVTARRLTVRLRDARGRALRDDAGTTCPPLVVRAR